MEEYKKRNSPALEAEEFADERNETEQNRSGNCERHLVGLVGAELLFEDGSGVRGVNGSLFPNGEFKGEPGIAADDGSSDIGNGVHLVLPTRDIEAGGDGPEFITGHCVEGV